MPPPWRDPSFNPAASPATSPQANGTDPDAWRRYVAGTATDDDLIALLTARSITPTEASNYAAKRDAPSKPGPLSGLYAFNPTTGELGYPAESPIGKLAVEGSPDSLFVDRATGTMYDSNGKPLPARLQTYEQRAPARASGGLTAYQALTLARQTQQQQVQNAIAYINELVNQAALEQKAQAQANQDVLAGAKWAVPPGTQYAPGFGPNDPAVRTGLATVQQMAAVPFNPYAVLAPGATGQAAKAALARLAG